MFMDDLKEIYGMRNMYSMSCISKIAETQTLLA